MSTTAALDRHPIVTIESLLSHLDGVEQTRRGWRARCPAHPDRRPPLSIALGPNGRVPVHDFGGCRPAEVLPAVGLTFADLRGDAGSRVPQPQPADLLRAALAIELSRERHRRTRLALGFELYRVADLVRTLREYSAEAHRLAAELGEAYPDVWRLVALGADAATDAAILESRLDGVDWRGAP